MKKKLLTTILACLTTAVIFGCSDGAAANTSGQTDSGNTSEEESDVNSASDNEIEADSSENNDGVEAEETFSVTYKDTVIAINAPMADIEAALGNPTTYFESTDCAFDGVQKSYVYGSIEIETYQTGDDTDYVQCIYFMDDLAGTDEGIKLFMTKEDVLGVYGTPDSELNNEYTYNKGASVMLILFDDAGVIQSITYNTTALN